MTREEKLELIAKDQGFLPHPVTGLFYSWEDRLAGMRAETGRLEHIPDYFGCLNACRKMEEMLSPADFERYRWILWDMCKRPQVVEWNRAWLCSSPEQRAEAYGLARGLWKEGE